MLLQEVGDITFALKKTCEPGARIAFKKLLLQPRALDSFVRKEVGHSLFTSQISNIGYEGVHCTQNSSINSGINSV